MPVSFCRRVCAVLVLVLSSAAVLRAAEDAGASAAAPKVQLPEIAEEPKTIDPATLMPEKLAVSATVDLSESSLNEVLDWLRKEQGLVVLLDKTALADINLLPSEPISDRLDDAPIYLLLNRLRSLGLAWYFEDDIVHVTSHEVASGRLTTLPYNIGDLLDADYKLEDLAIVILSAVAPDTWEETTGGPGVLTFLGDVMLVRQTDQQRREVEGLLAALRNHARQTFVLDLPVHSVLRKRLDENVSVDFLDTPLEAAVRQLAEKSQIDIRLDMPTLREMRVREREPVTLKLSDRKLKTVLAAMISDLKLTWILRDGVLWITNAEKAETFLKTAVYDVRDLCRDRAESDALFDAITSQASSDSWEATTGGPGTMEFAQPGTLVIRNLEPVLMEVLDLLETYRTALRASKRRERDTVDPKEVITRYYRLHANMAQSLVLLLPELVQPDNWNSQARPEAVGEITLVASPPDLFSAGKLARELAKSESADEHAIVVSRAVLIIRQTREAHVEITEVIRRVESGDSAWEELTGKGGMGGGMMGGMGGGMRGAPARAMGGFGGGYFSVPPAFINRADEE